MLEIFVDFTDLIDSRGNVLVKEVFLIDISLYTVLCQWMDGGIYFEQILGLPQSSTSS